MQEQLSRAKNMVSSTALLYLKNDQDGGQWQGPTGGHEIYENQWIFNIQTKTDPEKNEFVFERKGSL